MFELACALALGLECVSAAGPETAALEEEAAEATAVGISSSEDDASRRFNPPPVGGIYRAMLQAQQIQ